MQYEDWDIPEYKPYGKGFTRINPLGGNPRTESIEQLQNKYKEEYEKLKMYASFNRTLRDIEALPETRTDFGD